MSPTDIDVTKTSSLLGSLRIAIVHDYLNQQGGAEKVAEVFSRMFPSAPVYTSVYDSDAMPEYWRAIDVRTSYMQRLAPRVNLAKALLPLYPTAFESFDLSQYDLVLSSSSSFAKGVITGPQTCHVCYCYTPTRFLWMYPEYTGQLPIPAGARAVLPLVITPLRVWDTAAARRVDHFIGISTTVARRIEKYYRSPASVIEPPVDVLSYRLSRSYEDYYLVMARLHPYKRIDLAIEACNRLKARLVIVGDGPDNNRLRAMGGPTVSFLGRVSEAEARRLLAGCRALLWPGEEDFGLVPVEAQASGRPVVAYRAGGAAETVIDGETGRLFSPQTVDALVAVLQDFDPDAFDTQTMRRNAERYDLPQFVQRMTAELEKAHAARIEAFAAAGS